MTQEVLTLADRELYENRVRLERQLTKALPLVLADRVQMQQVLLSLIMNGIEAMAAVTNSARATIRRDNSRAEMYRDLSICWRTNISTLRRPQPSGYDIRPYPPA